MLQNECGKENMLRRKTAELNRKHIGELEAKLVQTQSELRQALIDPYAPKV